MSALRIAVGLSLLALVSCGQQVKPQRAPESSPSVAGHHLVRVNGYAIDVTGKPPAVPIELEPAGDVVPPDLPPEVGADGRLHVPETVLKAQGHRASPDRTKWIVQFNGPIHQSDKDRLAALRVRIGDYLPEFAFLVSMDDQTRAGVVQLPFVRGVARYKPAYKISRGLTDESGAVRTDLDATVRLRVRVDAADGLPPFLSEVHNRKGKVLHVAKDVAQVEVTPAEIVRIAQLEEVLWIEEALPAQLLNDTSRWVIQSYVPGSTPMWDAGLNGEGQIVGVGDTGLDYDACYFRDPSGAPVGLTHRKVVGYQPWADDWDGDMGHGTHVSGTVAGDQAPVTGQTAANGMASKAKIFMTDLFAGESGSFSPPDDLGQIFIVPYQAGAHIHTNSWGGAWNAYDTLAWSTDRFMWEHKDFLVLFANGNSGPDGGTVWSPATAKDIISVGASQNGSLAENVASFSSHGPAADGRLKPTLTAPGVAISSADSDGLRSSYNCGTVSHSGTSMATPTTAGAAALVRQYYADGYWPSGMANPADAFAPSAALLKATLINTAQPETGDYTDGPIPSSGQGWGRINLSNTLRFAGDSKYLEVADVQPGVATGETWTKHFFATGGGPLKITIVWTDYPGSQMAAVELVNDLDLTLVGPDGTTYLGNVFAGGTSVTGGSADRLNVEEQIYLPVSARGTYTIRVNGYNVPFGPQPFALVVTGAGAITSQGFIGLDRGRYGAATTIEIKVGDRDLSLNPGAADEAFITIAGSAEPDGETVRLVETGPDTGMFSGTIPTGHAPGTPHDGILAVEEGGAITATYQDANDGTGAPATVTATAVGDLTPPAISGVTLSALGQGDARIAWTTSEPTSAAVLFGKTPALGATVSSRGLAASHDISLGALEEGTTYYYVVQSTDEAGNVTVDDAGGALRTFTTLSLPPELTAYSSQGTVTQSSGTVIFGIALDPSGVSSLSVNGTVVPVRASDGYFELTVALALGDNAITVSATDGRGQTRTTTVVVTRLPIPDFTVTSVTSPEVVGLRMPFSGTATVCNIGLAGMESEYFVMYWYLYGEDGTLTVLNPTAGQPGNFKYRVYSPLASGACISVTHSVTANSTSLLGRRYHLGAQISVDDPDENPDNDWREAETWLTVAPPDLTLTALTAPDRVGTATPFDLTTTVSNPGLGKALVVAVNVYLSTDDIVTTGDRLIAVQSVPALDGGASTTVSTSVTIPSDLAAGTYRLGAIVDPNNTIQESNEGNNLLTGALVTVAAPDLAATSLSFPASGLTGQTVTFHDTVTAGASGGGASTFTVGIYLSPDPQVTTADVNLGVRTIAGLAPGASSSGDTTFTIPTTWAGGTYYVAAIADPANAVLETDEANNVSAATEFTIAGPDLVAASLIAPSSAVVGETIQVEDTVLASATGGASPAFDVAIYLSSDTLITTSDTILGWRSVAALAPGGSSTATTPATIPTWLPPGTYYVGVIVDDFTYCWEDQWETWHCVGGDVAKEPDATNNVRASGPIVVGGTDLILTELSASATGATGQPLIIHDTVAATGGGTGSFQIGYYLSTDATITTSDTFLGYRTVGGLPPGGTSTADTIFTVPIGLVPGTYYVGAIADYQNGVAESNEGNNTRTGNTVMIAGSDLTVSALSAPPSVGTATPFDLTVTVTNVGQGTSPSTYLAIYLSTDATITTSDSQLTNVSIGSLPPGGSTTLTRSITIFAAGTYYIGAIVDHWNLARESDETNNARSQAMSLVGPDVEMTAVSGPAAALTGQAITVTYTVSALPTGGGASNPSVTFYLSSDPEITWYDTYIGGLTVSSLGSGASASGTATLTIPAGIAGGTYYLGAYVNGGAETNQSNNWLAGNTVTVTGPDLVATSVSGPASAPPGGSISVSSTVEASAAGGAAPGFYVGMFLSTDATITASDLLLGYRWVGGLQPAAASSDVTIVTIPASIAPGTYYLGVIADNFAAACYWDDFDNLVCSIDNAKESDETNNWLAGGTIVVSP